MATRNGHEQPDTPASDPLDPRPPELTVRAVLTGMVIGALLTPCNVYSGLKIGWTFNMSVAAGLLGYAVWNSLARIQPRYAMGLRENNINQTAASSAASIISAGLAAPIPALALLTGQTLAFPVLVVWLFVVSLLGIIVAAGLRRQLLEREYLPFPAGIVTANTMREIHGHGRDAVERVRLLGVSAAFSAGLKALSSNWAIGPIAPPVKFFIESLAGAGRSGQVSAMNLGVALDPSVLMLGFGVIAGIRIAVSVLIGSVLAWVVLAPIALQRGWVKPGPDDPGAVWFGPLVEWLLWPGATLMVVASLASLAFSIVKMMRTHHRDGAQTKEVADGATPVGLLSAGFLVVLVLTVWVQNAVFGIDLWLGALAVVLSYLLAIVAARVTGETAITPIGALGKITQLTFGVVSPGNVTTNLMTANVTGGAAGQCADLMHDLRTGQIIGANPHFQMIAQLFGVMTGSLAAAAAYLALITDPQAQLLTPEWPAPAVATWKAVAEVLGEGLEFMPPGSQAAILFAAAAGLVLALAEHFASPSLKHLLPSASAIGLGFVIPAWNSLSLFIGAVAAALVMAIAPQWGRLRLLVVAAGLIVGESLAGVIGAVSSIFGY